MGKREREQGKRGERLAVQYLKKLGYADAHRTQQHNGDGKSDVVCEESLPALHIEVKFERKIGLGKELLRAACAQAAQDADGAPWVVLWKVPGEHHWCLTVPGRATYADDEAIREQLEYWNGGE